eukprot:TRINITY_DN23828_c0_g1_i1.p1 TRINITY_DN23828_c0_g1~~TRINITY_DN23828_c0_g1_i1.p1  ORF type:complete len:344 (+),score=90.17 TRINITY_DN23828_c0_g1_i1:126-1157(+)
MAVKLADRLAKTGKDLFIELVRSYSVAEVDDYFKGGLWQDELMKAHIELIDRHRREAGAPKIPDRSEIEKDVLKAIPALALNAGSAVPKKAEPCKWCEKGQCWTHGQVPKPEPGMEVTPPADAEQRLIALFIKKHSLDEAMANEVILKRPYHQRRHIYGKFKTENTGEEAATDLQKFVEECEKDKTWPAPPAMPAKAAVPSISLAGALPGISPAGTLPGINPATAAMAAALKAMQSGAAAGVKRPFAAMAGAPAIADPNKSARTNAMAMALAQRMAGIRAASPAPAIRPAAATPNAATAFAAAALAKLASGGAAARPRAPAWRPAGAKALPGIRPLLIVPQFK